MNIPIEQDETEQPARKSVYLLPNFFTTAALFFGFYAVISAIKGTFSSSIIAVYVAMIADSLDGRIARLTHTQSAFGAEYDSLSDLVAFGVAPAIIGYCWTLHFLGKFGWLVGFFYTASTALRLARFNIQETDKRYFLGLPCPSAAAFIVGMIWLQHIYHLNNYWISSLVGVSMLLSGLLMMSSVRYRSFKDLEVKGPSSFFSILIIILSFVGIALDPPDVLFGLFTCYVLSGPVFTWIRYKKSNKKTDKICSMKVAE